MMKRLSLIVSLFVLLSVPSKQGKCDDSFAFQVTVTLSPKAALVLRQRSEEIVVAADYFGFPDDAHRSEGGEMGEIPIAPWQEVRLSATGGTAVFKGTGIMRERIGWLEGRVPQVLLNVFSARLSTDNNLLNCDVFEGPVVDAQKAPVPIYCTLIEETMDNKLLR